MYYKIILIFIFVCLFYNPICAQNAFLVAGGHSKSTHGSVDFSIGQTFFQSVGQGPAISEGVQQILDISPVLTTDNKQNSTKVKVYPNPVHDFLMVSVGQTKDLIYQLLEMNGDLLKDGIFKSTNTSLDLKQLPTGIYVLKIISEGVEMKSFKIVKK